MGGGAEAQSGDFRGPWTVPEGSRLQRWICWTERARHCSDPVFLQIQGWPAVEVRVWYQGRKATTSSYDYLPLNKWDFVRTQLWWHCKKDLFFSYDFFFCGSYPALILPGLYFNLSFSPILNMDAWLTKGSTVCDIVFFSFPSNLCQKCIFFQVKGKWMPKFCSCFLLPGRFSLLKVLLSCLTHLAFPLVSTYPIL